jgi:hypothetical protein
MCSSSMVVGKGRLPASQTAQVSLLSLTVCQEACEAQFQGEYIAISLTSYGFLSIVSHHKVRDRRDNDSLASYKYPLTSRTASTLAISIPLPTSSRIASSHSLPLRILQLRRTITSQ